MSNSQTTITDKVAILAKSVVNRKNPDWHSYFANNMFGVVLAYYAFINEELQFDSLTTEQIDTINEAFEALLFGYGILEDTGFDDLEQIIKVAR